MSAEGQKKTNLPHQEVDEESTNGGLPQHETAAELEDLRLREILAIVLAALEFARTLGLTDKASIERKMRKKDCTEEEKAILRVAVSLKTTDTALIKAALAENADGTHSPLTEEQKEALFLPQTLAITESNASAPLVVPMKAVARWKVMGDLVETKDVAFLLVLGADGVRLCTGKPWTHFHGCGPCANRAWRIFSGLVVFNAADGTFTPIALPAHFKQYKKDVESAVAASDVLGIHVLPRPASGDIVSLGYGSAAHKKGSTPLDAKDPEVLIGVAPEKGATNSRWEHLVVNARVGSDYADISEDRARALQVRVHKYMPLLVNLLLWIDELAKAEGNDTVEFFANFADAQAKTDAWTDAMQCYVNWFLGILDAISPKNESGKSVGHLNLARNAAAQVTIVREILGRALPEPAINSITNALLLYTNTSEEEYAALTNKRRATQNYRRTNACDVKPAPPIAASSSSSNACTKTEAQEQRSTECANNEAHRVANLFDTNAKVLSAGDPEGLRKLGFEVWELTGAPSPAPQNAPPPTTLEGVLERGKKCWISVPTTHDSEDPLLTFGTNFHLPLTTETEKAFTRNVMDVVWPSIAPGMFKKSTAEVVKNEGQLIWVRVNMVVKPPNANSYWFIFDTSDANMRSDVRNALLTRYKVPPLFRQNAQNPPQGVDSAKFDQALDLIREKSPLYRVTDKHLPSVLTGEGVLFGRYYCLAVPKPGVTVPLEKRKFCGLNVKFAVDQGYYTIHTLGKPTPNPALECASSE